MNAKQATYRKAVSRQYRIARAIAVHVKAGGWLLCTREHCGGAAILALGLPPWAFGSCTSFIGLWVGEEANQCFFTGHSELMNHLPLMLNLSCFYQSLALLFFFSKFIFGCFKLCSGVVAVLVYIRMLEAHEKMGQAPQTHCTVCVILSTHTWIPVIPIKGRVHLNMTSEIPRVVSVQRELYVGTDLSQYSHILCREG